MNNNNIEGFRLSPQQKTVWSLQKENSKIQEQGLTENPFCSQFSFLIKGNLDKQRLENSVEELISLHTALRTSYQQVKGIKLPVQVIQSAPSLEWIEIGDITKETEIIESDIKNIFRVHRKKLVDVSVENTLYCSLIKLSEKEHILFLSLSSLNSDSATVKNILMEIGRIYHGKDTIEEPFQYLQFSEWQNEVLEEEDAEDGFNYWEQQEWLSLPPLKLPFERKILKSFNPHYLNLEINQDITNKIKAVAAFQDQSLDIFLLSCWQILISKLTEQTEIVINTTCDGRTYEELNDTLGLLAKSIPVYSGFDQSITLEELVIRTNESVKSNSYYQEYYIADKNQDIPISFEFQKYSQNAEGDEVVISLYQQYICLEKFKLKLFCLFNNDSLNLQFYYDANVFGLEEVKLFADYFETLLKNIVITPDAQIEELEILSDSSRNKLLVELNDTPFNYETPTSIHQKFEEQVEKTPDSIAAVYEDKQISYSQLNQKANQLAHYLIQLGVKPETPIPVYADRSLEMLITMLGVMKAGGAYLPIDTNLPFQSLQQRIKEAKTEFLITQKYLMEGCDISGYQVVFLDKDSEKIAKNSDKNPDIKLSPENLAYVIFTSGSTGKPKGVAVEHKQILNYLYSIIVNLDIPANANFAIVSTFAADLGHTCTFPALCTGGTLHIISQERATNAKTLANYFHQHSIDCLKIVPSHLSALLSVSPESSILPRQRLILGGEAASWQLIEQIQEKSPECLIFNHYGPTETTVGALTYFINPEAQDSSSGNDIYSVKLQTQTVPIGRPIHNTQLYILDKQLQPVPMGIPGELYIGGLGVARGYLNRPELTEERFITNPFCDQPHQRLYKTGDRVRYLGDGNVEFLGRLDNQVKIRGFRIELGEIEAQIAQYPTVIEAVVIAREDTPGDTCTELSRSKRLVAYLVAKPEMTIKIEEIREFLKAKLPDYMIPTAFVSLEELPLTLNGKIDRKALPAPQAILVSSEDIVLPSTPVEELLAGIWEEILGVERVGINNNFFDLGGHSLLGTQIIAKANKAGLDLNFKDIFEHQTIAELAMVATINNKIGVDQEVSQKENALSDGKITLEFLNAEAVLDETIYPETSLQFVDKPSNIFLTGATGFVGAFLLYELLQQTDAIIYCLIRATDVESGMNRLQKHLESSLLWNESFSDRIVPVIGDLSKPLLGLSEQQFQMMSHKIDVIYHNGASINLVYSYSTLKAANILGTEEIIRLASRVKVKPINYISTVSVLSSQDHAKVTEIKQLSNFSHQYIPSNGYPQTKWVAEKLITIAHNLGIPTSIYRLGRISGHSETGVCNEEDRLYRMIRGLIQIECAPDLDIIVDMTPVDYVSKAVIHLSMRRESLSKIFHLCNHQPISSSQLFDWISEFGYSLKRLSFDQWQTELMNSSENAVDNPLYSLLPVLTQNKTNNPPKNAPSKQQQPPDQKTLALNCQNTANGLADTSIVCPPADAKLLTTYFSYLIENGFLHPPSV